MTMFSWAPQLFNLIRRHHIAMNYCRYMTLTRASLRLISLGLTERNREKETIYVWNSWIYRS